MSFSPRLAKAAVSIALSSPWRSETADVPVPAAMCDEFCAEMARLAKMTIVGDGAEPGTQVGPIQSKDQYFKVLELIEDSKARGTIVAGGEALERTGRFVAPAIARDLPDDAPQVREEQFGPAFPVLKYDDLDDLVARANDIIYGLAGTILS
ncbi:aldehyde dehydrogenase family protein [Marinomonas sp. C1424]|uniref:Aldehyde dehydrogenase family protein n=1 Tax=Marinomonas transparens TaxID=2795388 RepID=A0A934JRN7_9GAMM|nr:aldehyde dehydrogenase family protein [Marinomonas transparens]